MEKILITRKLCKTYIINRRQYHVLKNIDLEIKKGEYVSIMGPSGSGKSTLLYNISSMDKMTSGEVIFKGMDLSKLSDKEISKLRLNNMGFIFQQFNLIKDLGIMDNIIIPGYLAKKKNRKDICKDAIELMKKTNIIELAENDITEASGGQLQRAAICRALINNPDIIFGDEPTGALNSKSADEILKIFHDINELGITIMLVTHDVKVAARTERVLFIKDGKIESEIILGKVENDLLKIKDREIKLSNWLFDMGW